MSPPLPPKFFALQLAFARRVADVTGMLLDDALLHYTTSYVSCGLKAPFNPDPENPKWRAFLQGLHDAPDPSVYLYDVSLMSDRIKPYPPHTDCFSYRYEAETCTVRLQFSNNDPAGSLKAACIPARYNELREMIARVAVEHPDAEQVMGKSWLYNLSAYTRLFPPAFVADLHPTEGEYVVVSSWGPFLDYQGAVKADLAASFLDGIARATTLDALLACFPYQVLATSCDIAHFYTYYGVAAPDAAINYTLSPSSGEGQGVRDAVLASGRDGDAQTGGQ